MILLFFSISGGEIVLVLLAVLVIFGPKRIPSMARKVGKVMGDVKKTTNSLKDEIMEESHGINETVKSVIDDVKVSEKEKPRDKKED